MPPSRHHAGLGFAFGDDVEDAGLLREKFNDRRRFLRRHQQINVADDFLEPPQTARRAATNHIGMRAQIFQHRLAASKRVAQQMLRRVSAAEIDAFENVRLRFFAETLQVRDLAVFAGRFQFLDAFRCPARRAAP